MKNIIIKETLSNGYKIVEVSLQIKVYENGEFSFEDSWVRIEDINNHFGIARRVDALYKFVSINMDGDKPVVEELVVNDLSDVTEEYKYMYKDDYITLKKSEPFYVNKGKILEKVR